MRTTGYPLKSAFVCVLCFSSLVYALDEREGFVRQLSRTGDVLTVPQGKRLVIMQLLTRSSIDGWRLKVDGELLLDQNIFGINEASESNVTFPDRCVIVEPGQTLSFEVEWARVTLIGYMYNFYCDSYPLSDLNKDCRVNLTDLAILASEWLTDNTA